MYYFNRMWQHALLNSMVYKFLIFDWPARSTSSSYSWRNSDTIYIYHIRKDNAFKWNRLERRNCKIWQFHPHIRVARTWRCRGFNINSCRVGIIPRSSSETDWFVEHSQGAAEIGTTVLIYIEYLTGLSNISAAIKNTAPELCSFTL